MQACVGQRVHKCPLRRTQRTAEVRRRLCHTGAKAVSGGDWGGLLPLCVSLTHLFYHEYGCLSYAEVPEGASGDCPGPSEELRQVGHPDHVAARGSRSSQDWEWVPLPAPQTAKACPPT